MRILRWIVFIPAGVLILSATEALFALAYQWGLAGSTFRSMLVLFALASISVLPGYAAYLSSRICPNAKVGALVLGVLYVLLQSLTMIVSEPWENISHAAYVIFKFVISGCFIMGFLGAYFDDE